MTTPQLIVWCQHDGCPEGLIPSDLRHLDNLTGSWHCASHRTQLLRGVSTGDHGNGDE